MLPPLLMDGANELERKSRIFHSDTNDILTVTFLTSNQLFCSHKNSANNGLNHKTA